MRILIAHSRDVIRKGLAACLNKIADVESVYTCEYSGMILKKAHRLKPDIILMDSDATEENNLKIIEQIRQELPGTRVVIITPFVSPFLSHYQDPLSYLDTRADGYIDLCIDTRQLSEALNRVYNHKSLDCPSITRALLEKDRQSNDSPQTGQNFALSKRELQVLSLVSEGQGNREIAGALFISENTVKAHLQNILNKLKVKTRMQAVILARQNKIIDEQVKS